MLIMYSYSQEAVLKHMVNVCVWCGRSWDIRFNQSKSHMITFGGSYSVIG